VGDDGECSPRNGGGHNKGSKITKTVPPVNLANKPLVLSWKLTD
jgi:hypothetical protein